MKLTKLLSQLTEYADLFRGVTYFGRFDHLILYFWHIHQVKKAIDVEKRAEVDGIFSKADAAKERARFGCIFNEDQRPTYDRLTFFVPEKTIQQLVLGRYLTTSGRIQRSKTLDSLLLCLVCFTLMTAALWLIGVSGEIALLNTVSLAVKAQVIATLVALISIPSIYLAYIVIEPIIGYREYQRSGAYISEDASPDFRA